MTIGFRIYGIRAVGKAAAGLGHLLKHGREIGRAALESL
jgi:hypothetical protein